MPIRNENYYLYALNNYRRHLTSLVAGFDRADILELGGGRRPSFRISDMPSNINSYTVNDIDETELAFAGSEYRKACFDVSGDVQQFESRYDVVFSRFLAEHVADGKAMHRNVHALLKPGGVAFHLIPTLYASPFIVNSIFPETLTWKLVKTFKPNWSPSFGKFPAHYSYCYGDSPRMHIMFKDVGYSRVDIRNFYGHDYYDRIPILRKLDNALSALASSNNWSGYSSYAYITAHK